MVPGKHRGNYYILFLMLITHLSTQPKNWYIALLYIYTSVSLKVDIMGLLY